MLTSRKRVRNVFATIICESPDERMEELLKEVPNSFRFIRYGCENAPTTGRKHYHAYIQLQEQNRMSTLRKLHIFRQIDIKPAKGTVLENTAYFEKDGINWHDKGERKIPGKRTDILELRDHVIQLQHNNPFSLNYVYRDKADILKYPRMVETIVRGETALKAYKLEKRHMERHTKKRVTVMYGPTGIGKSYYAKHKYGVHCYSANIQKSSGKVFLNGYLGQKILQIEEFYNQIPYSYLKSMLDIYCTPMDVKGSFIFPAWEEVYITTAVHPDKWYEGIKEQNYSEWSQLRRRISRILTRSHKDEDWKEI